MVSSTLGALSIRYNSVGEGRNVHFASEDRSSKTRREGTHGGITSGVKEEGAGFDLAKQ